MQLELHNTNGAAPRRHSEKQLRYPLNGALDTTTVLREVPRNRPGRPSFRPTQNHRELARLLAGRGIPQDEIARVIGVSPKTLRKHLRRELTLGSIEANLAVLKVLHKMACSGKRKHLAAAIFWAKCRCGFSSSDRAESPINSPQPHLSIYRREKPSVPSPNHSVGIPQ